MFNSRINISINHLPHYGLYPLPIHVGSLILVFHLLFICFSCACRIYYLLFPCHLFDGHCLIHIFSKINLFCLFLSCFFSDNFLCFFFLVFPFQLSNTLICNIKSICVLPCLLEVPPFELCSSLLQMFIHLHWKLFDEFVIQHCLGFIFNGHIFPIINSLQSK